jgi:hypothetical protein
MQTHNFIFYFLRGIHIDAINSKTLRKAEKERAKVTICLGELQSDSLTELKSDNVTFHKCYPGLVPNVGQHRNFNFLVSEKIRKVEKKHDL